MADKNEITKKQIREDVLAKRDALSESEKRMAADLLKSRIIDDPFFIKAKRVIGFMPFGSEIDIKPILEYALAQDKEVFVPRITKNVFHKEMEFRKIADVDPVHFSFGKNKILEPTEDCELYEYNEAEAMMLPQRDLMIMPGVAFDSFSRRVGYGGGYYDMFLEDKLTLRIHSIAVGYKCQLVDYEIPEDEGDARPFKVVLV